MGTNLNYSTFLEHKARLFTCLRALLFTRSSPSIGHVFSLIWPFYRHPVQTHCFFTHLFEMGRLALFCVDPFRLHSSGRSKFRFWKRILDIVHNSKELFLTLQCGARLPNSEHWWTVEVNCKSMVWEAPSGSPPSSELYQWTLRKRFQTLQLPLVNLHKNSIVNAKDWCAISVWFI